MNPAEIEKLGINNTGTIHYNLSYDELIDHELKNGECKLASNGATMVDTGIFTGRSPKDKYFVDKMMEWCPVLPFNPYTVEKIPSFVFLGRMVFSSFGVDITQSKKENKS